MKVSAEDFVYWEGRWTVALMQFRDNLLLETNAEPQNYQRVVEEVRNVLQDRLGIHVRCECANDAGECQENRMGPVCRAMAFCSARTPTGRGLSHVQPAALRADWALRHTPPLMPPAHTYKGYLSGQCTDEW